MKKKTIIQYWQGQVQLLLLYALMLAVMLILTVLYQMPGEVTAMTLFLSLPILAGFLAYRWHQYRKMFRLLSLEEYDPALYPADTVQFVEALKLLEKEGRKDREKAFEERKELVDYFSLWAHQTKLPLAVLRLLCEQSPIDTSAIRLQMRRLTQYVDMAMAFVRLESESDYKLKRQELDPIIRSAVRSFSTEFIHKKIRLDYEGIDRMAITDSKWLTFVIEQVLSNAIRYTPSGGTIKIYAAGDSICIQDTGCGIDPADLPRIFDQGFSGFNGHASSTSSGVGLYLCRKVLTQISHTIEIQSVPLKGTRVSIGMPQKTLQVKE